MPPTYEYRCERGHIFEVEERITDDPRTFCGQEYDAGRYDSDMCFAKVTRLIPRGTGFVLQGSGWGKDGYGSK